MGWVNVVLYKQQPQKNEGSLASSKKYLRRLIGTSYLRVSYGSATDNLEYGSALEEARKGRRLPK